MCIAAPIVIGFGLIIEATIDAPPAIQCAANLIKGGAHQSKIVKVIFLPKTKRFVEFVTSRPALNNL